MTQPQTSYNKSYPLSEIEWELVKELRLILSNGFGSLTVKVDAGKVSDVHPTLYVSKSKLRDLQK